MDTGVVFQYFLLQMTLDVLKVVEVFYKESICFKTFHCRILSVIFDL